MTESRPRDLYIILILGALSTVSPFAIDMYLPAFPQMAVAFHTSVARVSLSVSSYFVGLALGQVFYGPLLDRFGRKKPLYIGLALFLCASLGCLAADSVELLIGLRVLQALGGCAAQVAAMALVRDLFPVKEGAKVFSLLMLIVAASPMLAPTVGSFLSVAYGWQSVFVALALVSGLVLLAARFYLPEGRAPDQSVSLRLGPILRTFGGIVREPQFYTYAVSGAFSFAGLFAYVTGSPNLFLNVFHVSAKTYGMIFAGLSVGFIGSAQLNILLTRRFRSEQILRVACIAQMVIGLLFLAESWAGWDNLTGTTVLLFAFLACVGVTNPNAAALALAPFHKSAGSAAALLGFLQIGVGALASAGVGLFDGASSLPMVAILAGTSLVGLVVLSVGRRHIAAPVDADMSLADAVGH